MSQAILILQLLSNTILLLHERVYMYMYIKLLLSAIKHVTDLNQKLFSQAKYHTGKKRYMVHVIRKKSGKVWDWIQFSGTSIYFLLMNKLYTVHCMLLLFCFVLFF